MSQGATGSDARRIGMWQVIRMREFYRIGEISALFGIPVETLRYYDAQGLIVPERIEPNGYRLYSSQQFERIATVLSLRHADASMQDIRALLGANAAGEALARLDAHAGVLDAHLRELERTRARLDATRTAMRMAENGDPPVIVAMPALHLIAIPFQTAENVPDGELDIAGTRHLQRQLDPAWVKGASVFSTLSTTDLGHRRYHRYAHYGLLSEEPLPTPHPHARLLPAGRWVAGQVRVQSLAHEEVDAVYDRMRALAAASGLRIAGPALERTVFDLTPSNGSGHIHFFTLMIPVSGSIHPAGGESS